VRERERERERERRRRREEDRVPYPGSATGFVIAEGANKERKRCVR
jgi:hypothetical protein